MNGSQERAGLQHCTVIHTCDGSYFLYKKRHPRWASVIHLSTTPPFIMSEIPFVRFHYIPNWGPSADYAQFLAPHFDTFLSLIHGEEYKMAPGSKSAAVRDLEVVVQDEFQHKFPSPPSEPSYWYYWRSVGPFQCHRGY